MMQFSRTNAGTMQGTATLPRHERFQEILTAWQVAANAAHYERSHFSHPNHQVHGTFGKVYARLDIGGSGAFMVEIETGIIFGSMGYGKVDKKKVIGNIYDPNFDAAVLVRDRFRYGRFVNNSDGSIPAGTVVKR